MTSLHDEHERAERFLQRAVAAERERDEARAEVERLRADVLHLVERGSLMFRERDEARAEIERWRAEDAASTAAQAAAVATARAAVVREVEPLRAALAELVRLKDGPRDDAYREAKDGAWEAARVALRRFGSDARPEGGAAPGTPERFVEILRDVQARDARPDGGGSR